MMPRLFAGETFAFAVRAQGGSNVPAPLVPTTSNLTQSIYMIGNFVCFFVLYGFGKSQLGRRCLTLAASACVVLNLVFVALDLGTYWTGTGDLMYFIRNSTYSMLNETEIDGLKRIVGSFVEASQFSYWTLGYFAYTSSLWLSGVNPRLNLALSFLSLLTLVLSTSTTAYVGLAIYLCLLFAKTALGAAYRSFNPQTLFMVVGVPITLAIVVLLISLNDTTSDYVGNLLNNMVVNKMSSGSGIERSSWNAQAMQNFFDTFGFGAGNGSVRSSSFVVAVIASLGVVGTVTYGMFLLTIWSDRGRPAIERMADAAVTAAARAACLAWIIAASLSSGFIDLGLPFFAYAALACARPQPFRLGSAMPLSSRHVERVEMSRHHARP
jgi:hypothetical protein